MNTEFYLDFNIFQRRNLRKSLGDSSLFGNIRFGKYREDHGIIGYDNSIDTDDSVRVYFLDKSSLEQFILKYL